MAKVMIMAGGTGGHVFPGLALAEALKKEGVEICWLGTVNGMEKTWVEKASIPFYTIKIKGLRGNGLLGWLKAPVNIFLATRQAKQIIRQETPDLVLGMGGFVCGPGGLAAKLEKLPLVIHEQNAIPGLTNKLLAKIATKIITAFPQNIFISEKMVLLGNPVRSGLEELRPLEIKQNERKRLLVLGGSRGALALNETLPKALALIPEEERPEVYHQTGEKTFTQATSAYQNEGLTGLYTVVPFIDDMVTAYYKADLVLCRSGALTVSELLAAARPAIMVPYPHAVDDHQTANAKVLCAIGGGEVIKQNVLTPELLASTLQSWLNIAKLEQASKSIRAAAPVMATERITALLMSLLKK